ncbi:hypothetical protein GH714_008318 [Hevea brasiliensis]|uniref:Protein kinase domain-containing protein n=1 Tax=Hevea brasiliensis TaxID=3981 RepID=A0A6A6LWL8_HEVBR|nr:hypothetical protein GH714_008318 [Hevea brasiliensis]
MKRTLREISSAAFWRSERTEKGEKPHPPHPPPPLLGSVAAVREIPLLAVKWRTKFSDGKVTNITPGSVPEVKVTLPAKLIFEQDGFAKKYCDGSELAQLPKVMLGEGTMGTLFKLILNCGFIVTARVIRQGLVKPDDIELWINFFGGIRNTWLLPMHLSFWCGGEAFVVYEYLCLGSLEELLHGSEGIRYTPLSWEVRKHIALCAAMAIDFIHNQVTKKAATLSVGWLRQAIS